MDNLHKNLIIWQKWADPFGDDDTIDISSDHTEDDNEYGNFEDPEDTNKHHKSLTNELGFLTNRKNIRVMATPMGIIPFTENTASSKIFNFWTGHTNFTITKNIALLIEEVSGVETLDIFTRYRFRIAIGKAFKDSSVMQHINEKVYEYLE